MVVTSNNSPVPGTAEKADNGAINDVTVPSVDSALAPAVAMPTNVNNVNAMSTVAVGDTNPAHVVLRSYGQDIY